MDRYEWAMVVVSPFKGAMDLLNHLTGIKEFTIEESYGYWTVRHLTS